MTLGRACGFVMEGPAVEEFEPCLPDQLLNDYLAERLTAVAER